MSPEICEQEIPSFDPNKQFVVSQGPKISKEQQKLRLQIFWYREEILKRINANWRCRTTGRCGILNLRHSLRSNAVQLGILKKEDVEFLVGLTGDRVEKLSHRRFSCPCKEYVQLIVTIRNRFREYLFQKRFAKRSIKHFLIAHPVKLILRLQPVQSYNDGVKEYDLSDKLLIEGVEQVVLSEVCCSAI